MTKVYVVESGMNVTRRDDLSWCEHTDFYREIEGIFDSEEKAIDCMIYTSTKEIEKLRECNTELFYRSIDSTVIEKGINIRYAITEHDPHLPEERCYWVRYESYDLM